MFRRFHLAGHFKDALPLMLPPGNNLFYTLGKNTYITSGQLSKAMNISENEFKALSLKNKIRYLYMGGTFLMDIRYYQYKINLYMLNNFYVEVFYHHCQDKIEKVEIMEKQHSRMKFYADQIRLP